MDRTLNRRPLRALAVAGALASALLLAGNALGVRDITIGEVGFLPGVVNTDVHQDLSWTNSTGVEQSVTSDEGLFDSGPIAPGGGYSMRIRVPGTHSYRSVTTGKTGTIIVPWTAIPGPTGDPVADHIPDAQFPPAPEGDIKIHGRWGVPVSKTRIILGFKPNATVAQANAALSAAGTSVAGGLPAAGIVLALAPEVPCPSCDPFEYLTSALASLRANAAVEFAAMSLGGTLQAVPRGPGDGAATAARAWTWATKWDGGNWGLKVARFPSAWNLLESVRRKGPAPITGIIDGGFDVQHPDLAPTLTVPTQLCPTPTTCRSVANQPNKHGTHVAGIIGAAYDNETTPPKPHRSHGISGGNPVARMQGFSTREYDVGPHVLGGSVWLVDQKLELFDLVLRSAPQGLRVINYSGGVAAFVGGDGWLIKDAQQRPIWWKNFPHKTCGPGTADDEPTTGPGTKDTCTPDNEDGWQREFAQVGRAAGRLARLASEANVMIVQSAGNDSTSFCNPESVACHEPIHAENRNEFAWASAHWTTTLKYDQLGLADPVLVVESMKDDGALAPYSSLGGDVAAPGENILSTVDGGKYELMGGTSMAAPFATALVGYVLGEDPSLGLDEVRRRVVAFARPVATPGEAPRLDAFATVLAGPGAAKRLVDVNDDSRDGNRRIIRERNPDGTIAERPDTTFAKAPDELTAPDGYVDMRDFRRFRDAYLQVCAAGVGDTHCPAAADISLDGDAAHPKRDLNFDRCVEAHPSVPQICNAVEPRFSRFDFNGDGDVGVIDRLLVPLKPDGKPAASYLDGAELNDLEVLQGQWSVNPKASEGWGPDDLVPLLLSADVEVHADALFTAGASRATLQVRRADLGTPVGPERTLKRADGYAVMSIPLGDDTATEYEVLATAETADGTTQAVSERLRLDYGEDRRLDICGGASLKAQPALVAADGASTARIQLALGTCGGTRDVADKPIEWTLSPATGGAALDLTPAETDANGKAAARFRAGTGQTSYTVKARVTLGEGISEEVSVVVRTVPKLTIKYVWKQVFEEYAESGSTRWTEVDPLRPDCAVPGVVEYCIDASHVELVQPGAHGAQRDGTLVGGGSTFELTESLTNTVGRTRSTWTTSKPDGTEKTGEFVNQWFVTDPQAYQGHDVRGLRADDRADGVHLGNLESVGNLPYHYALTSTRTGGDPDATRPIELGALRTSMLLVPQDGRSIRFAAGPGKEIVFPRRPDGTLEPFRSCGRMSVDLTTQPGYYVAGDSEWIPGAATVTRKRDYASGDRPMPVGPGHLRVRYEFAAVAVYAGETAPAPELPDCTQNHPPTADFSFEPPSPGEGRQVAFTDRSTDPENDISKWEWSFGDGTTASTPDPHHLFPDNGTYAVTLTVTDKDGETSTTTRQVVVRNLAPEAELRAGSAEIGKPLQLVYKLLDPGSVDKTQLQYSITSTSPVWPPLAGTREANVYSHTLNGLPVGTYHLTLTVRDKDGAETTSTAVAVVTPPEEPPDDDDDDDEKRLPSGSCDPTFQLDAEETHFLDLVNEYRELNGLEPVVASPSLGRAAEAHVHDMASNGFLSHIGSDGSTPAVRAWRALYPKTAAVGENVLQGTPSGRDALWGWRGSTTGHNENMLDPAWRVVGIAREQGSGDWYWATSYGDENDCPHLPPAEASTAVAPANAAGAGTSTGTEVQTVQLEDTLVDGSWTSTAEPALHDAADTRVLLASAAAAEAPAAPPTAAFRISKASPTTGRPVTFTNRSRDALGNPVAATLWFGDGSTATVGPDASVDYSYEYASEYVVRFTATDSAGAGTQVIRRVNVVDPPAPWLEYTGPDELLLGGDLTLTARATTRPGGPGVEGLTLTFELRGVTGSAVTDANGVATAQLPSDGMWAGTAGVLVRFDGSPEWSGSSVLRWVTLLENGAPTADAGGPYALGMGNALLLDGSGSTDPDGGDSITSYEWDLDGDGAFDDASGVFPLPVNWDRVSALVCGGQCSADHDYTVALRVTDAHGLTASDSATVRFTSDFALTLGGETRTVVPGKSNSFAVGVIASGGFTEPVTLAVEGLPAGVTAAFSVNPVPPGSMSVLTLTAAQDAQTGQFPIVLSGTAGGVTRTISDELRIAFGLIPICYGTIAGTVTDRDTGEPLAGVKVADVWFGGTPWTTTDTSGRFVLRKVQLGQDNAPLAHWITATKDGWWEANGTGVVACGGTTTIDLQLVERRSAHASGRVVEGVVDPADPTRVIPTDKPLEGASVIAWSVGSFPTDSTGAWAGELPLGPDNSPATYSLSANAVGYWPQAKQVTVDESTDAEADFALVKQCFGTIKGGRVLYEDTQEPAPAHAVRVTLPNGGLLATITDGAGNFVFDKDVLLGHNNAPVSYLAQPQPGSGDPPGTVGRLGNFKLIKCGDEVSADLFLARPPQSTATVEGYVTDDRTNEPLADVAVWAGNDLGRLVKTDANGYYKLTVSLGWGTSGHVGVNYRKPFYEDGGRGGFLAKDQVVRWDTQLHRPLQVDRTVTGLVRDAATGAPIAGAAVRDGCFGSTAICVFTDGDGRYTKTLWLDDRVPPFGRLLTASADGYWSQAKSVTLAPGETTTADFELVRKCETARVVGIVVDAETQAPIENATVAGGGVSTFTDAAGHFALEGLEPDVGNMPLQVAITASAEGYFPQTKTVTIFCGATIVVDFGRRETALGTIVGRVTLAGEPRAGVFIGTEFGGSATTDAAGEYRIEDVPLGDLNADREWKVTALPEGLAPQTKTVLAKANVEVRADFAFGSGNTPPTATAQELETAAGTPVPVTLAGSDPDGDELTFTVTTEPAHGTLAGSPPELTYTPEAGWSGTDSFTFVASDGVASSEPATVTIAVGAGNEEPTAADDTATVTEDGSTTIDVLANDSPGAGEASQQLTASVLGAPAHGLALVTGAGVLYVPEPEYNGEDAFTYLACDDGEPVECASASATVSVTPVNDRPEAANGSLALDEDAAPTTIDLGTLVSDVETAVADLELEVIAAPAKGVLTGAGPVLEYDPDENANGADSFTYRVVDRGDPDGCVPQATCAEPLASEVRTIQIAIAAVNDAPTVTLGEAGPVAEGGTVALAAQAADVDGDPVELQWQADGGALTPDGATATLVAADGPGTVSVQVAASDGTAAATASTSVAVTNVAPAVDAGPDLVARWGVPVPFTGTASDPSAADTEAGLGLAWSFGDGSSPAGGAETAHAYAAPGTYTATFEATDKDGARSTDDLVIQIVRRETTLVLAGETTVPFGTTALAATLADAHDPATAELAGREVVFELAGATYRVTTDASGLARVSLPTPLAPGTYPLALRFEGDERYVGSNASVTLEVAAATTAGRVTGADLRSSADGRGGFTVRSDGRTVKGELQYESPTAGNFHAATMTALGILADGRTAWFAGSGDDGTPFVAYVEDNGEPSTPDVWRLWIAGRLESDGPLLGGNIQVHRLSGR